MDKLAEAVERLMRSGAGIEEVTALIRGWVDPRLEKRRAYERDYRRKERAAKRQPESQVDKRS